MISLIEIENAYNEYSKEIFSYILRSVHDHDTAEDVLQDTFIKLIHYSEKKYVQSTNIRALLYTIARSVIIDNARKSAALKTEIADMSSIPDLHQDIEELSDEYILEKINSIISSMDEPEKSIILLRQSGLTYQEISSILKISERTLKRKTRAVIGNIRKILQDEGFIIFSDTLEDSRSFND